MAAAKSDRPKYAQANCDPFLRYEAVDVGSLDYTPSNNGIFIGINASAAGLIHLVGLVSDTVVAVHVITGWNNVGGRIIKNHGSNTATIKAAALEV